MSGSETQYQARFFLPEDIIKGREEVVTCPVYFEGSVVEPDSGTVTLLDASGNAVLDEVAATISSSVAQYTIPSSTLSDSSYGDGWLIKWTLVFGTVTREFINEATVSRYKLYPVLTDLDIYRRVPALNPNDAATIVTDANYQGFLEEAWIDVMNYVIQQGNRPNLILSPTAIRVPHLHRTLELIYRDLGSVNQPELLEEANRYAEMFSESMQAINFRYDTNQDGTPNERRVGKPVVWLLG